MVAALAFPPLRKGISNRDTLFSWITIQANNTRSSTRAFVVCREADGTAKLIKEMGFRLATCISTES